MNYNYFDIIDTEEKAYWLGFIFADGNVSKDSWIRKNGSVKRGCYKIEISLKSEDTEHLQKFANAIEYEKPIRISKAAFRKERCRIFFNNKHMWTILNSYGCTPNKSLTVKFPDIKIFKNKWLIISFIRGYVDGDGCISYCNSSRTRMCLKILGTEHMLLNIQKQIPLESDNKLAKKKGENISELTFNDKRGAYICSILYNGADIYLNRKYEKYKEFCRLYEGSYRVLSSKYGEDCDVTPVVND